MVGRRGGSIWRPVGQGSGQKVEGRGPLALADSSGGGGSEDLGGIQGVEGECNGLT